MPKHTLLKSGALNKTLNVSQRRGLETQAVQGSDSPLCLNRQARYIDQSAPCNLRTSLKQVLDHYELNPTP